MRERGGEHRTLELEYVNYILLSSWDGLYCVPVLRYDQIKVLMNEGLERNEGMKRMN